MERFVGEVLIKLDSSAYRTAINSDASLEDPSQNQSLRY